MKPEAEQQETVRSASPQRVMPHTLGLRGQFAVSSHLQRVARDHSLSISRLFKNQYFVSGASNLETVCPDHIKQSEGSLDRENLVQLLKFLHQPIGESLTQEQRESTHKLLRFMGSGSVEIPRETAKGLEKDTAECHAETEQAMRDEDAWNTHREIGNDKATISSIPNSSFDPREGFKFSTPAPSQEGPKQRALVDRFWTYIDAATDGRYANRPSSIALTATELRAFCEQIEEHYGEVNYMISQVEHEEAFQSHLHAIEDRAKTLTVENNAGTRPEDRLTLLLQATTALTPLFNAEEMRKMWSRYHFMKRNDAPLAEIAKDFQCMHNVMRRYAEKGDLTEAELTAITQEFYPLLSFAKGVAETLGQDQIAQTIGEQSPSAFSLSDEFRPDGHSEVLDDLNRTTGKGGSRVKRLASATWDTTADFVMDVTNFLRESPKTAAAFVGLAGTLYYLNSGGDTETAQQVQDTLLVLTSNGFEEVPVDPDSLPEAAKVVQNWHWDLGPLGPYKHYMYDNAVVGPANTILDWVRMGIHSAYDAVGIEANLEPKFSKTASEVTEPLADNLFNINLLQNVSHVAFWMYTGIRGFRHGLKGFNRIFELLSPVTDLACQAIHSVMGLATFRRKSTVANALNGKVKPIIAPNQSTQDTATAMADAAVERESPDKVWIDRRRLHHEFDLEASDPNDAVTQEKISHLEQGLEHFDMVLASIADKIGVDEPWYQKFLQEKIRDAKEALVEFKASGNLEKLKASLDQTLTDVIAAEIRITDHTTMVQLDEKTAASLRRHANAQYGALAREHRMETTEKATVKAGTYVWDKFVKTARAAQKVAARAPIKTTAIATASAMAASVGLDMAGYESTITDALSSCAGGVASCAVTGSAFLVYNFWEDVLGVHVLSGASLILAGALAGRFYRNGLKPVGMAINEDFFQVVPDEKPTVEP